MIRTLAANFKLSVECAWGRGNYIAAQNSQLFSCLNQFLI